MFLKIFILSHLISFLIFAQADVDGIYQRPSEIEAMWTQGSCPQIPFNSDRELNLLIWNSHKDNFKKDWTRDFLKLSEGKDLVLLQEIKGDVKDSPVPKLPVVFNDYCVHYARTFGYLGETVTGNVTLSTRMPIDSFLHHSEEVEPVIKTPKVILFTAYELSSGQALLVANIHGINFVDSDDFIKQIERAIKVIEKHQGPVLFAGDFNTWSKKRLKYLLPRLYGLGFQDAKFDPDDRMRFSENPLDHVFVRDLKILESKVLVEIESSDHKPMLVKLTF